MHPLPGNQYYYPFQCDFFLANQPPNLTQPSSTPPFLNHSITTLASPTSFHLHPANLQKVDHHEVVAILILTMPPTPRDQGCPYNFHQNFIARNLGQSFFFLLRIGQSLYAKSFLPSPQCQFLDI